MIETMLVVAIVSLLIVLLAPSLAGVRGAAREAVTLSNLRQCGRAFAAYTQDWSDSYPAFTDPRGGIVEITLARTGETITVAQYFMAWAAWNYALADGYFEGQDQHPAMFDVGAIGGSSVGRAWFEYPCAFIARPEFWNPSMREGARQYGNTRSDEVVFTDKKFLLVSSRSYFAAALGDALLPTPETGPGVPIPAVFTDGHARRNRLASVSRGMRSGEYPYLGFFHLHDIPPGMHTLEGVRGRDIP